MVNPLDELRDADRSLFPSSYTMDALRDSRYHNTAYAIAELIDNSIDATAEQVQLLCMEQVQLVQSRQRQSVIQIAVLDNGAGMDVRILFEALKFGGGTRHRQQRGIGKYGMGLPTSSVSQCKRVDVWTWQNGLDSYWHSSIDVDDYAEGNHSAPIPDQATPIPSVWRTAGNDEIFNHQTGTLVVWSNLDKIQWKSSQAIINNVAREVGRIHRHFINADISRISAASFLEHRPRELLNSTIVLANDPLYLMSPSSVPEAPWDNEAMFRPWLDRDYVIVVNGREETISVKYSIVTPEALRTENIAQLPGNTERGKHARHNIGVSVVREDREIVLEGAFQREGGSATNPQNRWWGCEVSFFRNCDELFGVDHNKQMAAKFTQAARTLAQDDRDKQTILDELGIEDDPIYDIVGEIRDQTRAMMNEIRQMFEQRRGSVRTRSTTGRRTPDATAAQTSTDADSAAIRVGLEIPTQTDRDRADIPAEEREAGLMQQFIESGQSRQDALDIATTLVRESISYRFNPSQLDGYQFFNVRTSQGVLHINLNTDHPIYDLLRHIEGSLEEDGNEDNPTYQASVAIRLLLSSWARMEDQTESRDEQIHIQDIAMRWGRQVDKMIRQLRDRDG